jgi:hypothetical protein
VHDDRPDRNLGEDAVIYQRRNVTDSPQERLCFEKEAAAALTRHYRRPMTILFSCQPGRKPNTIDLRAIPHFLGPAPGHWSRGAPPH